jgi:hypothetical protein
MPVLAPNQPLTLDEPVLLVENRLAAGRHRFSLVVRNARGVASEPQVLVVTVGRLRAAVEPAVAAPPPRRPRRTRR